MSIYAQLKKEVLIEIRDPRVSFSLFALGSVVGIFGGLGLSRALIPFTYLDRAIPVLWLCLVSLITLFAVERSFEHEREDRAIEGFLIVNKNSAESFFLIKTLVLTLISTFSAFYLYSLITVFSSAAFSIPTFTIVVLSLLLSMGVTSIGLFVGSMTSQTRGRLILLPVLGLPLLSPLFFSSIEILLNSFSGLPLFEEPWFWFLLTLDLAYVLITTYIFPYVIRP